MSRGLTMSIRSWNTTGLAVGVCMLLLAVGLLMASARPVEARGSAQSLGDCFGGLFTEDPFHCYALEQAQKQKIVTIQKIYDDNGVLYLSITGDEVGDGVYQFLKEKASEFFDRWPRLVPPDKYGERIDYCMEIGSTYRACLLERVGFDEYSILPYSSVYENIRFQVGGESARRKIPGWASWRQVWPSTGTRGASGTSGTPTTFDVSDVDRTNLPEITGRRAPSAYWDYPDLGVAGWHHDYVTAYVQVKTPPHDEAAFEDAKEALIWETDAPIVFTPVEWDYGELWDWAAILNRFASSASNTIGIRSSSVGTNTGAYLDGTIWPLEGLGPAAHNEYGNYAPDTIRETIVVFSRNPQATADALPVLLPLLDIPLDAVGIVSSIYEGPSVSYSDVLFFDDDPFRSGAANVSSDDGAGIIPLWAIIAIPAIVALMASTSFLLWRARRRRGVQTA